MNIMKNKLLVLMLGLLVIFISSCAANNKMRFTALQESQVAAAMDSVMNTYNIPGAVVGVWEEGKDPLILTKGLADKETGRLVQATDHFRIASITKTFTGTVVLQLIDEGKISFEATLDNYFPAVTNASQITIRQVLGMTAGIYDFVNSEYFNTTYYNDLSKVWTHDEILALIYGQPADFAPGTSCKYSNTNFYLLGMIIEEVTGNKVEDEIKTRIFDRLGMSRSSFPTGTAMTDPYCHGYNNIETGGEGTLTDVSIQSPSAPWTSGAIISNIYDLRIWVEALYNGTLLSAATQAERMTWNDLEGTGGKIKYGLGIINLLGLIGHNGEIEGYNTDMYYLPSKKAAIVCLTNNASNQYGYTIKLTKQVVEILYPDMFD